MNNSKSMVIVAVLIIALGIAWLLNTLKVIAGVDWVWTCGLGITGILVLALGGLNKLSFVAGPFLIVASIFSVLRQTGKLRIDIEVPILFIVFGVLFLIALLLQLPTPSCLQDEEDPGKKP